MNVERSLATVLFTDIVSSTERAVELGDRDWRRLLREHHAIVRRALARYGGREVSTAGDGFLAIFEDSSQAILCASAVRDGVRPLGLEIRAGLHTGQVEWEARNVGGIAVHIGARVAGRASGGEVLVSSTVHDLEVGSGFGFIDRGVHPLKGVPGEWRLFAVSSCPISDAPTGLRWRLALQRQRGVLAGALAFLALFLLAGVYMGIFERDGGRGAPPESDSSRAAVAPGGAPDSPADRSAKGGTRQPVTDAPTEGAGQPAGEGLELTAEARGLSDTSAGRLPSESGRVDSGVLAHGPEAELARLRTGYEAARTAAEGARRDALAVGAASASADLLERADAARDAGLTAGARGTYAEAGASMASARRQYDRAREAAWKAKVREARESLAVLRAGAASGSSDRAEGETWEEKASAAEKARRYSDAVALLARAGEAYRRAAQTAKRPVEGRAGEVAREEEPPRPAEPPARETGDPAVEAAPLPSPPGEGEASRGPDAGEPEAVAQQILGELRQALEAEDVRALRRTWASLSAADERGFEHWFDRTRDIRVKYDVRSVTRAEDALVVTVRTTYDFIDDAGEKGSQSFGQILELARREGRWVIVGNRQ